MGNFNRDNHFDRNRNSGRRNFDRPQMFQAVCSNCGKNCEVPFRPTGSKPVLCSDCFEKRDQSGSRSNDSRRSRDNFRRNDSRPSYQGQSHQSQSYQQQFDEVNKKLDTILSLLSSTTSQVSAEEVKVVEIAEEPITEIKPKRSSKKA